MKNLHIIFVSFIVFGIGAAYADSMSGMNMKDMDMKSMPMPVKQTIQVHHAIGVVKSIDADKGTITIAHQAVPSAKWPAMTMGFKATKDMMASVKPEQNVEFEFTLNGMEATLMKITVKN